MPFSHRLYRPLWERKDNFPCPPQGLAPKLALRGRRHHRFLIGGRSSPLSPETLAVEMRMRGNVALRGSSKGEGKGGK